MSYFRARPYYTVDLAVGQAFYENPRTGVYFSFETASPPDDKEESLPDEAVNDDLVNAGVAFNLNYFRPHIFGLEAEPELTAFVRHFDLSIEDPQIKGMGRGTYSPEGFLRGWNEGNLLGYRMALENPGISKATLSSTEIDRIWQWNFHSARLQQELGEDVFVPRLMYAQLEGTVRTFAVWADAISVALPKADYVVLARHELAKRRLFGLLPGKMEACALTWSSLETLLSLAAPIADHQAGGYYLFNRTECHSQLMDFFRAQQVGMPAWTQLPLDSVLDDDHFQDVVLTP